MGAWTNCYTKVIVISLAAVINTPVCHAAYTTASGASAKLLEAKLNDFLLQKSVQDFGFSIYQQGRDYSGNNAPEYVSSNPDMDFVSKHKGAYCSMNISSEKSAFNCQAPSGVSQADAPDVKYLEMGDINTATLLEPIKYSNLTDITAQNYIRNVISPFPEPKFRNYIADGGFMDDGAKKKEYAQYMAGQAVLGVALYSMNEMYGMRVKGVTMGVADPVVPTAALESLMSIIQNESTKRFEGDATFLALLNQADATQVDLLKEIAAMESFRLWMDYQRFRQMERIEALLAASLAKFVNDGYASANMLANAGPRPSNK